MRDFTHWLSYTWAISQSEIGSRIGWLGQCNTNFARGWVSMVIQSALAKLFFRCWVEAIVIGHRAVLLLLFMGEVANFKVTIANCLG
ncbi:Uncharacterised protein [Vibrio cholerae]|uniref:Uncharacterized protein n=1 Tax=Vibrio cholerae TaxID=666 RepID=A0A656B0B3_VIBCL|nr:Uncharacterised protein [Vibrio cholerae]CSB93880.1 Uncharacterised protein [Vibrio cholerae]CSD63632.1 Uncharacterised protein [Vibrio cholerae]CSD63940.1 Uncharacterised protein [Vibrio cholerae]